MKTRVEASRNSVSNEQNIFKRPDFSLSSQMMKSFLNILQEAAFRPRRRAVGNV